MATLTLPQLDSARQTYAADLPPHIVKTQLNAVFQAIENVFESAALQNALSSAIDAALSPATATAQQKRFLVRAWLRSRFERGN